MNKRLELIGVSKRFGDKMVFSGLNLFFPMGKSSCVMGPSGCGKTTLLRLLMGLELPDSGEIYSISPLSVVFQEDRLLNSLTPLGNLRLIAGKGRDEELTTLLAELGLTEGLKKPLRGYSGGMNRRVAIARALLVDYELLLLDEPFKGLDEETRARAAEVILTRARGKTIILVTHDPAEAALMKAEVFRLS
jgi:NitT/TauT family transport system ATP-binding protein